MKVAMLTGGGDVPGVNAAIKTLAKGALERGWEVLGIRSGWHGLAELDVDNPESVARWVQPLMVDTTRIIQPAGNAFLPCSRVNPSRTNASAFPKHLEGRRKELESGAGYYDLTQVVIENLEALGVDVLFPIGGDDTLGFAERVSREGLGVIGIPKTMDNDLHGTDYCLGFATCVSRTVEYLNQLRTIAAAHERFAVVEVMGRHAGFTSLIPALLADADRALIAEVPFDIERLTGLLSGDRQKNPSRCAMVVVSEGATAQGSEVLESAEADAPDDHAPGGIGRVVGAELTKRTQISVVAQSLGYLVRSGAPDPIDVMVASNFAHLALELAEARKFGRLVRIHNGVYGHASMAVLNEGLKRVNVDLMYDVEQYRPRLRSVLGMPLYLGA